MIIKSVHFFRPYSMKIIITCFEKFLDILAKCYFIQSFLQTFLEAFRQTQLTSFVRIRRHASTTLSSSKSSKSTEFTPTRKMDSWKRSRVDSNDCLFCEPDSMERKKLALFVQPVSFVIKFHL